MITQKQIAEYMIDCLGYSQEDIADFNDDTSVFCGKLQDILSDNEIDELVKFTS